MAYQSTAEEVVIVPRRQAHDLLSTFHTALVEEGRRSYLYPNPRAFPIYESLINFTGAKASARCRCGKEKDFRLDPNETCRPHHGPHQADCAEFARTIPQAVSSTEQGRKKDIAAAIGDRDIMVLSDEIYSRLIF